MAKRKEDRFADMRELSKALQLCEAELLGQIAAPVPAPAPPPAPPPANAPAPTFARLDGDESAFDTMETGSRKSAVVTGAQASGALGFVSGVFVAGMMGLVLLVGLGIAAVLVLGADDTAEPTAAVDAPAAPPTRVVIPVQAPAPAEPAPGAAAPKQSRKTSPPPEAVATPVRSESARAEPVPPAAPPPAPSKREPTKVAAPAQTKPAEVPAKDGDGLLDPFAEGF